MGCNHLNPAGYVYCGTCGSALEPGHCRCGFVAAATDAYCGRCGASLAGMAAGNGRAGVDADQRFDLERMVQQAAQEKHFLESTDKARVTQDDIRKLIAKRRKQF